tara:strand:- start:2781 stop:3158 length:378 start_codon:yes stop_codon:yes gene_type:complete
MKILILTLILSVLTLHTAAGNTWSKNDKVTVFFMCREEKDIMDVALADSTTLQKYLTVLTTKQFGGNCSRIFPPILLSVYSVISGYQDHRKKQMSILKLYDPNTDLQAGYILAEGSPANAKETSH